MKNQNKKPLVEALDQYVHDAVIPFHTPGHKQGRSMDTELKETMGEESLQRDLTEVEGLDNLHQPESVIRESQMLAADLAGAEESWFLVGGRVAAYYASLASVLNPGDQFLMDRHIGEDGWRAAVLGNNRPILLPSCSIHGDAVFAPVDEEYMQEGLRRHPDAKAVLLKGTTAAGIRCNMKRLANVCREKGVVLLVDDSANPTAIIRDRILPSSLQEGADLVISTAFRFEGAPAQAAIIHKGTDRIVTSRMQVALQTIQSTSPSYLIMGALDELRYEYWRCGIPRIRDLMQVLEHIKKKLRTETIPHGCLLDDLIRAEYALDPLMITVCFPGTIAVQSPNPECCYGRNFVVFAPIMGSRRIEPEKILNEIMSVQIENAENNTGAKGIRLGFYSVDPKIYWCRSHSKAPLNQAGGRRLTHPFKIPGTDGGWLFPGEIIPEAQIDSYFGYTGHNRNKAEINREVKE